MTELVPEKVKNDEEKIHVTERGGSTPEETIEVVREEGKPAAGSQEITYMTGSSFYFLFLAIEICIFLANIEISIVGTSLVTIANYFEGFDHTSWIVSAYLTSYTCFLVVWAKIGDIFGRKWTLISSMLFYIIFSGACGASQSIPQLIVLRVFQGIGASGAFSVAIAVLFQLVPKAKLPMYMAITFAVSALSTVAGPLLGGLIDIKTTWRWIFLFIVPAGIVSILLLYFVMPAKFPYHQNNTADSEELGSQDTTITAESPLIFNKLISLGSRIDFVGSLLLLVGSFTLLTALLEANVSFKWSSGAIIALLVLAVLSWTAFFVWEWYITGRNTRQEPLCPWSFFQNRVWLGILMIAFWNSVPMIALTIILPQRFQAVNGDSPWAAGVQLLAFCVAVPIGSIMGNAAASIIKKPIIYHLWVASSLELLGVALMLRVPISGEAPKAMIGYQIVAGLGAGATFSIVMLVTPQCVKPQDIATATSLITMVRMIGAAFGVAISGSIVNGKAASQLTSIISLDEVKLILQDLSKISTLSSAQQLLVREVFGKAYSIFMKVVVGLATAQLMAVALIWKRPQLSMTAH